ncbi:hypothetical protein [Bradyrhizobium retamae]|uniref:Uncharacterized protein n=1 Tax=Bradyrhizobium retamae TaxID=1300035 RepID=A0A0R3MU23_9BRAD|nr:hypothetical protein [Bradyrhizobium retamae]KRR21679.1 hypothetical protein CQ13_06410 [Bradyrhizobium retamae]
MAAVLSHGEGMLVRRALGLERSRSICRNRVAVHANGEDIRLAECLADKGAMFRDPREDYGSMRVFRVTPEGARAVSKKLPPALTIQPLN